MKKFRLTELLWIIAAAILLWLVVLVFNAKTLTLDVPLTISGLEPTLAIADNLTTIKVSAEVKSALVNGLQDTNNISAVLDVSEFTTVGKYQVVPVVKATLPEIKIINFSPKSFEINIVPRVSRLLTLKPQTVGFVASGFTTGAIALSPDSVAVSGPENIINNATYAIVPIKLNEQTASFVTTGEPELQTATGQKLANLIFLPKEVAVSVEVKRGSSFKAVGLKPTFSGTLPAGYWLSAITFNPQALTIKGDGEKMANLDTLATTNINLNDRYGNFEDKVAVELPAGIELLEPNLIEVSIKISTAINNRELNLIPKYVNVTVGFGVSLINPTMVSVIISGSPEKLAKLSRANVSLDLDLRGALSGLNKIDLTKEMFKIPEGTEVVNFTPKTLEVTLTKS
jgi:YbbR domain-containing protein